MHPWIAGMPYLCLFAPAQLHDKARRLRSAVGNTPCCEPMCLVH